MISIWCHIVVFYSFLFSTSFLLIVTTPISLSVVFMLNQCCTTSHLIKSDHIKLWLRFNQSHTKKVFSRVTQKFDIRLEVWSNICFIPNGNHKHMLSKYTWCDDKWIRTTLFCFAINVRIVNLQNYCNRYFMLGHPYKSVIFPRYTALKRREKHDVSRLMTG